MQAWVSVTGGLNHGLEDSLFLSFSLLNINCIINNCFYNYFYQKAEMRAWVSVTGRLNHGLEDRMEDVNAHGRADGVFQDGLVVFAVELVARLKCKKKSNY
jgi:hypothetical protein